MLADKDAFATIAVTDTKAAKKFYEDVLGLQPVTTGQQGVPSYKSGDSSIKSKGVTSSTPAFPDTTRQGNVHVSGENRAAWFKDPDGNILSLVNG